MLLFVVCWLPTRDVVWFQQILSYPIRGCRTKILHLLGHFDTTKGPRGLIPSQDVDDFGNNCRKAEKQDEFPANRRKTHVGILLSWTNGLSHRIAGKNRTVQVYIRGLE